jgi:hypothetical protein
MGFDLGQLFNPLSLFGAAQQEIQQFQNMLNPTQQSDQAGASSSGRNLLSNLGIGDLVTQFTKSQGAQSSDPCNSSDVPTETGQQQAACTSAPGYAPPASKPPDPELLKTLEALVGEFNEFDAQYAGSAFKDGKFDRGNLATIEQNPNDFSPSVQDAAHYLLAHPDVFDQLCELSGGDGCVTARGAQQYQNALMNASSAQTQSTATQPAYAPIPTLGNENCASASSGATASNDVRSTIAQRGQAALDNTDAQINSLMNGPMDAKSMQQLQQLMEKRQEMFTALSNIDKCFHDMCMTAINNMR